MGSSMTKRKKNTGENLTDPPLTERNNLKGQKQEENLKKQRTEPNLAKGGSPVQQSQTQRKASTEQALAAATKEYMRANKISEAGPQSSGGGLMVPTGYAQSPIII